MQFLKQIIQNNQSISANYLINFSRLYTYIFKVLKLLFIFSHLKPRQMSHRYIRFRLLTSELNESLVRSLFRDAKSPVSGGRLPYLDVHYGLPYGRTYLPFVERFPCLLPAGSDIDKLQQFVLYQCDTSLPNSVLSAERADMQWHLMGKICDTHNKPQYDLLALVMKGILVIPHCNADSERIFSQVRLNQTQFHPNMGPRLLQSTLIAKTNIPRTSSVIQHVLKTGFCNCKQNRPQLDHCKVLVLLLVSAEQ